MRRKNRILKNPRNKLPIHAGKKENSWEEGRVPCRVLAPFKRLQKPSSISLDEGEESDKERVIIDKSGFQKGSRLYPLQNGAALEKKVEGEASALGVLSCTNSRFKKKKFLDRGKEKLPKRGEIKGM